MWNVGPICYVELTRKNIIYVIIICKLGPFVLYEREIHYFSLIITISQTGKANLNSYCLPNLFKVQM